MGTRTLTSIGRDDIEQVPVHFHMFKIQRRPPETRGIRHVLVLFLAGREMKLWIFSLPCRQFEITTRHRIMYVIDAMGVEDLKIVTMTELNDEPQRIRAGLP